MPFEDSVMIWRGDVSFFFVTTPCCCTGPGSCAIAAETRFWTRTCAKSRSVPTWKVTVSVYRPSAVQLDCMYNIFSTPLTCCSIGSATVSTSVFALAPG